MFTNQKLLSFENSTNEGRVMIFYIEYSILVFYILYWMLHNFLLENYAFLLFETVFLLKFHFFAVLSKAFEIVTLTKVL